MSVRLFQEICVSIRRKIANGSLRPGDKLASERELADEFKVGRPVIREALRSLEEAGILEFKRGVTGGAFIRAGDSTSLVRSVTDLVFLGAIPLESVTEARSILLRHTAELAAQRGTDEDFDLLEANTEEISKLDIFRDEQYTVAAVSRFYDLLGYAAKNEMLVYLIHSVSEVVGQILIKARPSALELVVASRRRLLRHLRARQPANAGAEVVSHLYDLHNVVLESAAQLHTLRLEPFVSSRGEAAVIAGQTDGKQDPSGTGSPYRRTSKH